MLHMTTFKKNYNGMALCTQDLYAQHRGRYAGKKHIMVFFAGKEYPIVDESLRNKLVLIDELGKRHSVSGNRKIGWLKFFIIKRRVLIEKYK